MWAPRGPDERPTWAQATGLTDSTTASRSSKRGHQPEPRASCAAPFAPGAKGWTAAVSSYRATLGIRRYKHDELEGDEVGTHFDNDTEEAELLLSHTPVRPALRDRSAAPS